MILELCQAASFITTINDPKLIFVWSVHNKASFLQLRNTFERKIIDPFFNSKSIYFSIACIIFIMLQATLTIFISYDTIGMETPAPLKETSKCLNSNILTKRHIEHPKIKTYSNISQKNPGFSNHKWYEFFKYGKQNLKQICL